MQVSGLGRVDGTICLDYFLRVQWGKLPPERSQCVPVIISEVTAGVWCCHTGKTATCFKWAKCFVLFDNKRLGSFGIFKKKKKYFSIILWENKKLLFTCGSALNLWNYKQRKQELFDVFSSPGRLQIERNTIYKCEKYWKDYFGGVSREFLWIILRLLVSDLHMIYDFILVI